MERRVEVIPIRVKKVCDKCKRGFLVYMGARFTASSALGAEHPTFPHKCDECGATASLDRIYPRMEFEELDWGV